MEHRHSTALEGWNLDLRALSAEEPERLVRFLTGALLACGGWVLTRTTQGQQAAEMCFEFARAASMDIYSVLLATGLELSRESHEQMADLCNCANHLDRARVFEIARVELVVYRAVSRAQREEFALTPAG